MSCGRPVITTDAVGCRETVKDGYNGILVKVRDEASLSEAMLRLSADDALAERMGQASRTLALSEFDVYKVNETLIGEIKKLY